MTDTPQPDLPVGRNLKIGLFHLGSGMADVITTGIWNRVMISDLGYAATPVGLLVSLRYFLAPISVWAGRMSDRYAVGGYRRLFWIWLGRALMAISIIAVGLGTAALMRGGGAIGMAGGADAGLWLMLSLALILFSFGNAISGSTFLALIYDRSSESQRGRAVGIVWTFLLIGFAVGGIAFGLALPAHSEGEGVKFTPELFQNLFLFSTQTSGFLQKVHFNPELLQNLFIIAALILGTLWFVALVGEERRAKPGEQRSAHQEYTTSALADLRLALKDRSMRFFFGFLSLSMLFAFSQDLILEPFGGQVFGMPASVTTRFTAYWAVTAILGTILFLFLSRRFKWLTNTTMSIIGVAFLIVTFALFALSAFAEIRQLVTPGLIALGIGLGIWNVGALGLMMDMSPFGRAGTFLGFWTLVVTLARGIGVAGGGILRDLGLSLSGSLATAYGLAFLIGAIGLTVSLVALLRVNVRAYKAAQQSESAPASAEQVLVGAMD
jgi:BCD family chlorophyll transporter-like MFS transporter